MYGHHRNIQLEKAKMTVELEASSTAERLREVKKLAYAAA